MKKLLFASIMLVFMACEDSDENDSCYNPDLVHNDACTADCPGFEGCDGKTYCNACEAARVGIGPAD